jgi:hypothetical protein
LDHEAVASHRANIHCARWAEISVDISVGMSVDTIVDPKSVIGHDEELHGHWLRLRGHELPSFGGVISEGAVEARQLLPCWVVWIGQASAADLVCPPNVQ